MIPSGENQKLYVVNARPVSGNPAIICCITESKLKDFRELYKGLNAYGKEKAACGIPQRINEIFLAFCNGQWHRAVVLNVEDDGERICLLIDLQSMQKIKAKHMRTLPKAFQGIPPMAEHCILKNPTTEIEENNWINADVVITKVGVTMLLLK